MKKTIVLLVGLLFCCNVVSLFSMRSQFTKNDAQRLLGSFSIQAQDTAIVPFEGVKDCDDLSRRIDVLVKNNRSLAPVNSAFEKQKYLSDAAVIDALSVIYKYIPHEIGSLKENDIFVQLQQKNKYFQSFIERFIGVKVLELDSVTGATLDTVLSHKESFGSLPNALKRYIFIKARGCFFLKHSSKHFHDFKGHTSTVRHVVTYEAGGQLASSAADKTVRVWNKNTGLCDYVYYCTAPVTDMLYSPDGSRLAVATNTNTVAVFNSSMHVVANLLHAKPIFSIGWSDQQLLTATEKSFQFYLWDLSKDVPVMTSKFVLTLSANNNGYRCPDYCDAHNNVVRYTYEDELLTVCKVALANCTNKKNELEKIVTSRCVEDLSEISRMPFKITLAEKMIDLERSSKK